MLSEQWWGQLTDSSIWIFRVYTGDVTGGFLDLEQRLKLQVLTNFMHAKVSGFRRKSYSSAAFPLPDPAAGKDVPLVMSLL